MIGGVAGGVITAVPVAPPKEVGPKAPVRIGGRLKEPKIIHRVEPVYPVLAKQVHVQGVVQIEAIVDQGGECNRNVSGIRPSAADSVCGECRTPVEVPADLSERRAGARLVKLIVIVTFQLTN